VFCDGRSASQLVELCFQLSIIRFFKVVFSTLFLLFLDLVIAEIFVKNAIFSVYNPGQNLKIPQKTR